MQLSSKNDLATFRAILGKIGSLFVPSPGHTDPDCSVSMQFQQQWIEHWIDLWVRTNNCKNKSGLAHMKKQQLARKKFRANLLIWVCMKQKEHFVVLRFQQLVDVVVGGDGDGGVDGARCCLAFLVRKKWTKTWWPRIVFGQKIV